MINAEVGSICGLGRSPGEGNGNPLQYSCLTVHGVAKSRIRLSDFTFTFHLNREAKKDSSMPSLGEA